MGLYDIFLENKDKLSSENRLVIVEITQIYQLNISTLCIFCILKKPLVQLHEKKHTVKHLS